MYKPALTAASIFAVLAVILGAFGAHALKQIFTPDQLLSFETGVRYQFYHAFALLFTGVIYSVFQSKLLKWAVTCFILGIIGFSGSIYLLTYLKATSNIGLGGLGIITPIGGLFFIAGWILLFFGIQQGQAARKHS
jgi:uncharacterized membrane protein YgdD (TMEM256/DUF423 family)